MPMSPYALEISGPDAAAVAADLQAAWSQEFAEPLVPRRETPPAAGPVERAADPIAVAALILTIPQTALAMLDIAQRMDLVQKLTRFLASVRQRFPAASGRLLFRTPSGRTLVINSDDADVVAFLTALEEGRA